MDRSAAPPDAAIDPRFRRRGRQDLRHRRLVDERRRFRELRVPGLGPGLRPGPTRGRIGTKPPAPPFRRRANWPSGGGRWQGLCDPGGVDRGRQGGQVGRSLRPRDEDMVARTRIAGQQAAGLRAVGVRRRRPALCDRRRRPGAPARRCGRPLGGRGEAGHTPADTPPAPGDRRRPAGRRRQLRRGTAGRSSSPIPVGNASPGHRRP